MRLPDDASTAVTLPEIQVRRERGGVLAISGKPIELALKREHRREFVERVFSVPEVESVSLHPDCARVHFARAAGPAAGLLKRLANAMRSASREQFGFADLDLVEVLAPERPVRIRRAGDRLTFLDVKPLKAQRFRFSHPELRDGAARSAVVAELMGVAYVAGQSGSLRSGGSIEADIQVGRMSLEKLVGVIESVLLGRVGSAERAHWKPIPWRKHLVDINLGLAVLSDFLFAPARVLSVLSLWTLNARHVDAALRSVRRGKTNLDTLYVSIAFLTLLSLSFIGSAVMYWTLEFWPRRVKRLRESETAKFMARLKTCPRSAWVQRDGSEMEVELGQLRLGDTIILRPGDVAPGDGVVLSGEVDVIESWAAGLHRRRSEEVIHCSGRVAAGEARMRLVSLGQGAVTSKLAELHMQSLAAPLSHERVKRLATSAVLPTLVLGAAAIFRGGVSMAKGVIRPDYVTGPSVARELGWIASAIKAARTGVYVANDIALEKLAQCNCMIFSPEIRWQPGRSAPEEVGAALRELGVEEILAPSERFDGDHSLALLGEGIAETRPVDTGGLIKERQFLGKQVAFIGDCNRYREEAAQADVAVHVCHPPFHDATAGQVALLSRELEAVLAAKQIAVDFHNRLHASFATALIPNAACVIGAVYFGVPILGVVALTNAGTLANYWQGARELRAAGRWEA
jgi:hypothetical protein